MKKFHKNLVVFSTLLLLLLVSDNFVATRRISKGVTTKRQHVAKDGESTSNNILHNVKLTGNVVNNKQYGGNRIQSNYIGDDMEGDIIEQYNGDKTNHLRSNSSTADDEFTEMSNLEEYQGYPNEASVMDKSSSSTPTIRDKKKKDYSTLRTMKDAIAVDDTLIDNELKALDQEDLKIGAIKQQSNLFTSPSAILSLLNQKHFSDDQQSDVNKNDVSTSSVAPHNMTLSSRDQMVTSKSSLRNESEDLEQMTKELLQINVDANGKVQLLPENANSGKHLMRESVLKQPLTSAVSPSTKSRMDLTTLTEKENNKNTTDLSHIIESALKSDSTSNLDVLNVAETSGVVAPKTPTTNNILTNDNVQKLREEHRNYQNSTIEDTDIVNSVIKSVSAPMIPSQTEKQEKGDRKANLAAPFFNQNNPILNNRGNQDDGVTVVPGKRKLNAMQNELLMEMFKGRSSSGNTLSSKHSKRKIIMSDKDMKKIELMKKKKKKKKRKRFFINRLKKRSDNEGFAGAISYTDEDGHELTYTLGLNRLTYDNARLKCRQSNHGDLVTIDHEKEQDFIVNNVITEPNDYWIGLDDRDTEGNFQWVDNSALSYTHWGNMEPDDGTNKRRGSLSYHNEDCTVIKDTTEWNDMNCNDRHMFICKKPIIKPGGKDVEWRPVYANSLVKLNQNIPYEEFTEKHNDTCGGDTKSNICGSSSSDDSKQNVVDDTSSVVMPGGNGGSSQIHLTSPSLTNDVDEQETLTTGQAIIRVPSSYHHRHEVDTATESQSNFSVAHTAHTGTNEDSTQSLKSNTSSPSTSPTTSNGEIENQKNHKQDKTSSVFRNANGETSQQENPLPSQQQQQQQDGNAVAALNKAVKEIEQEQEKEMRKGLSALNSIDNLVDNLKNQYNNSKDESSGRQLGITIDPPSSLLPQQQRQPQQTIIDGLVDPAEVRKKVLAFMKKKLSTPMVNAQPLTLSAMVKPDASPHPADSVVEIELSKQSKSDEHPTSSSSTFKPNPKTVETICKDSCKKDIDGCMESCRDAVTAMNPVEFLRTLQSLNHRASDVSSIDQSEASDRAQSGERRETSKGYTSGSKDTGGSVRQDNVEGVSMIKPNHVAAGKVEGHSMLTSVAGFVGRKDDELNKEKTHNDGLLETLRSANDHQGRRRNHRHQRKMHHHKIDSDENLTEISNDKDEKNEKGNSHQDQIEQNPINNDEGPLHSDTSRNEQPDESAMDQMGDKWSSRNTDEGSKSFHQEEEKDLRNPESSRNNDNDDSSFGSHKEDMYMERNDLAKEFLKHHNEHSDSSNYENFNHESGSHKEDSSRDEEEPDPNHGKNRNSKHHEKSSKHKEEEELQESEEEDELLKSGKYINSKHHTYHESLREDSSEDKGGNNKTEGVSGFIYRPLDIHMHSVGRDEFPYHLPEPKHYNSIEEALKANPDINDGGASHYLQDPGQHQHALEPDQSTVGNGVKPTIKQFDDKLYVAPDMNTDEAHIHDEHSSSSHLEDSFPPREFDNHDARETVENHRSRESGYSRTSESKDSQTRESKDFQDSQTRGSDNTRTNGFSPDAPVIELHLGEVEKDKNPRGVSEDSTTPANLHKPVIENHRFGSLANELKHRRLESHLADMRNDIGVYRKTHRNVHQMNHEISSTGDRGEREFLATRHINLHPLKQKASAKNPDLLAPQQGKYDSSNRSRKNNRLYVSNDENDLEEVAKAKSLVMEFKKLRKQLKDTYHSLSNGRV